VVDVARSPDDDGHPASTRSRARASSPSVSGDTVR
jgi:hypothetical protein